MFIDRLPVRQTNRYHEQFPHKFENDLNLIGITIFTFKSTLIEDSLKINFNIKFSFQLLSF